MASFYSYLPLLQQVEGGFQKNPKDPGNYNSLGQLVGTNYGISARFYEGVINRPPSQGDMKAITKQRAESMFKNWFWDLQKASQINNQAMANTIIDHQVNAGSGAKLAQQVLNNDFGYNMSEDNKIGPITLQALNSVDPARFVHLYNEARANHYRSIGNPTFEASWLIRLKKFTVEYQKPLSMVAIVTIATVGYIVYHNFLKQ